MVPRLFCSKGKNPFFLIVTNAAALQELSVLIILLSKLGGKLSIEKIAKT